MQLIHTFRLTFLVLYIHMSLYFQKRMAYRASFIIYIVVNIVNISMTLLFIDFLYRQIPSIASWEKEEAFLIVASYLIIESLGWIFTLGGLWQLDRFIKDGSFDLYLVKPFSALLQTCFQRISLEEGTSVIVGVFIIGRYLYLHPSEHLLLTIVSFILAITFGFILYSCVFLILKCVSFKKIDTWAVSHFASEMLYAARYPHDIFRNFVLRQLTRFLVPLAFIGTVPASVIRGENPFKLLSLGFLVTCVFILLTFFIWKKSLRHYSSASS